MEDNNSLGMILKDLHIAQEFAYTPAGLTFKNFQLEEESRDYGAAEFELGHYRIKFRMGKITSKKSGSFVTFWKRIGNGPILPYHRDDPIDFYIISVRNNNDLGQFIFPKSALYTRGILASESQEGKRAFRLYAPWDQTPNQQAKKTKEWQSPFFTTINHQIDLTTFQQIFTHPT